MTALRLVAIFAIVPSIEVLLLIEVGTRIGTVNTIFLIILTGILGAYLMRLQGFQVLKKIQEDLGRGVPPAKNILEGAMILVGGILLLTPGFFTDAVGFLLLIPRSRRYLLGKIHQTIERRIDSGFRE